MKQPPQVRPERRANRDRAIFPAEPFTPLNKDEWRVTPPAVGKASPRVPPPRVDHRSKPANVDARAFCVSSGHPRVGALQGATRVR